MPSGPSDEAMHDLQMSFFPPKHQLVVLPFSCYPGSKANSLQGALSYHNLDSTFNTIHCGLAQFNLTCGGAETPTQMHIPIRGIRSDMELPRATLICEASKDPHQRAILAVSDVGSSEFWFRISGFPKKSIGSTTANPRSRLYGGVCD